MNKIVLTVAMSALALPALAQDGWWTDDQEGYRIVAPAMNDESPDVIQLSCLPGQDTMLAVLYDFSGGSSQFVPVRVSVDGRTVSDSQWSRVENGVEMGDSEAEYDHMIVIKDAMRRGSVMRVSVGGRYPFTGQYSLRGSARAINWLEDRCPQSEPIVMFDGPFD